MKHISAILLAIFLCLGSSPAVFAEEPAPLPIQLDSEPTTAASSVILKDVQSSDPSAHLLWKVYEAPPDYDAEQLKGMPFERNGLRYTAADLILMARNYRTDEKTVSQTVSITHSEQDNAAFAPILDYEMDGYTGQLQLDPSSIRTEPVDKKSYSYTITDTRTISGLARNDTYAIPKTALKNGVSLQLSDIHWTDMGGMYTAEAVYAGKGYGTRVSEYISTAAYMGTVKRCTLDSLDWKVVYEGAPIPLNPLPVILWSAGGLVVVAVVLLLIRSCILAKHRPARPRWFEDEGEDELEDEEE